MKGRTLCVLGDYVQKIEMIGAADSIERPRKTIFARIRRIAELITVLMEFRKYPGHVQKLFFIESSLHELSTFY